MRIMGLDYGDKTIGVAVSDELGWTAQGVEVIRRKSREDDRTRLAELIREYTMDEIVVGMPKNMNGTIGPRGEASREFADQLAEWFGLPVHLWDERLTTVAAQRTLIEADVSRKKRKGVIDKMAAQLILQGFLDSKTKR
ncbi:Holliday junction resolvase RuvX [Gorillibacterium sp. CAU 1737]|uniref:Holliday junction resolvase RuvX n=1 Tax=Gorillibacterium sp. CAU 1737 TaxID=3140362 RepID=UPI003261A682